MATLAVGAVTTASLDGGPAIPVAVNVTLDVTPVADAVMTFAPTVFPSVQLVAVAIPSASVVAVPPPLPPPDETVNVTLTFGTARPSEVVTFTLGRDAAATALPATELNVVALTAATFAGVSGSLV